MIQDQYTDVSVHPDTSLVPRPPVRRQPVRRGARHLLSGLGFALVLTCLAAILWLMSPGGSADSVPHTLVTFLQLPRHQPLLWLVPVAEVALGVWISWTLARPLAVLAYLKAVARSEELYRVRYTPLRSWAYPYDLPVFYAVDNPDPLKPRQTRTLTPLELIEILLNATASHMLLLGAEGSGKTYLLHEYFSALAQRRRYFAFRRAHIPVYIPLKYYALLLQASDLPDQADFSLLTFLTACDQPGLHHLRPYLNRLYRQGRLLLVCDGLDEVPAIYRSELEGELIQLFRQARNSLLLTCTPELYEQSDELLQAVGENLVPRATLQRLENGHVRSVVERFITELDTSYHPNLPTAGQVMSVVERTRLREICTTPLYLFALLACIDTVSISELKQLDTRGRLLQAFLLKRLEASAQAEDTAAAASDTLLFLRELACVARWKGDSDLLSLPVEAHQALTAPESERGLQHVLLGWTREQQVYFPFAENAVFSLAESLPAGQALTVFQHAYRAGLIEIDEQGILSFRHELLVSALLAEYLAAFLGSVSLRIDEIEVLPDDLVFWGEPLVLWAGLLADPLEAAEALALYARTHEEQRIRGLAMSLICLGVAQTPPGVDLPEPLQVPPALELALLDLLDEQPALEELAALFQDCAAQGVPELYQALFPLLLIEGSEAFIRLLNPEVVSELLVQRLIAIIDDEQQDQLAKRLVRALSSWGAVIVRRAAWLSSARSGSGSRLRSAAINILAGTRAAEAVEPLMDGLRDADAFIVRRASHALLRLGADLALPRLLQELSAPAPAGAQKSLREQIFSILERYLNEANPARQLRPEQFEQINEALMSLMHTQADAADLERARELLISQGRLAEERDSGKIALRMLVQKLATANDDMARSMTGALKEVGSAATPSLLEQLEDQPSEAERVRILEVLASLRDKRALPALLRLLEDHSQVVQRTLATTLAVYAPGCIPGLIDVVLHHPDEQVAGRAEQILGSLGLVAVDPVIQALTPQVEGRTLLLVNILVSASDARAVPALLALLRSAETDLELELGVIQALGQFHDERAVRPLMGVLSSDNPLLYEEAINALSNLGELACGELLLGLDTSEKTPLLGRMKRALLGMNPFPGELLLRAVDEGSAEQAGYIEEIFLMRGMDAAQVLAANLFYPQPGICAWVRRVMGRIEGRYAVPALLELLDHPEPAWREQLALYLLKHPQEAVPSLVDLLGDPERYAAALAILPRAGRPVFPALVPALSDQRHEVQTRAISLLVEMVSAQNEFITEVVQLFGQGLTPDARIPLVRILTEDLAEMSLPALLEGLEDAHLVGDVSATLVTLARRDASWGERVTDELIQCLRDPHRRHGAALTLVDLGSMAVMGAGALITDDDPQVAHTARQILGEIGTPAFPFLWAAHSDASHPERREAAREIFRAMPTPVIKDELVALLTSARHEDTSMALSLLLERIHDDANQPGRAGEMLAALLEHVQTSNDERASLRILALLLLLGGSLVVQPLVDALYANPQRHEHLIQVFLLLDQGVEQELQAILKDGNAPIQLQAEIAGVLAMRALSPEMEDLALSLSEHGLWAGRSAHRVTTVLQPSRLDISLRALGGLLAAGHWNAALLQDMRALSKAGGAHREIIDILLGWRYSPEIARLQQKLEEEAQDREREREIYTRELLALKSQNFDLEHDVEKMRKEQEEQHRGHEQQSQELQETIADLNKTRQQLQNEVRQLSQEKQALLSSSQQISKERERLQAEAQQWQSRYQQLEKDLNALRRSGSGS